ncbi:MAG: flagellar basal body L-ring protein FlgH [Planctomycetota bacterium]|jgi:flagellar L-ring protein precursor FlgH
MRTSNILTASIAAVVVMASATGLTAQNLYLQARNPASPIDDLRASRVGDILAVLISETHKVKNEDKVNRKNESNLAWGLEQYTLSSDTFNVLPVIDSRTEKEMIGNAKQEKDSSLTARVSVVVVDVQPNGNLVVAGTRVVQIDDETKTLRISGLVRALDVTPKNTVTSSQVADARVSLTGDGGNNHYVTKGPMGALFEALVWAAWPF